MTHPRNVVAYLCHEYPKLTETFVYREIDHLRALGMDILVFSMKKPTDVEKIEGGEEKVARAQYLPPDFSFRFFTAQLKQFVKSPVLYIFLLLRILSATERKSAIRLQVRLGFFLRGVLLADLLQKRKDIGLLHCPYTGDEIISAHTASRLSGIPLSFTVHAPFHLYKKSPLLKWQARDAIFISAISEDAKRRLAELAGKDTTEKIKVVHCGIDTANIKYISNSAETNKIVSVGSLVSFKGHDILIRAMKILIEKGLSVECEIIGEGKERRNLERLIDELRLKGIVRLVGAQPQSYIWNVMEECTVFVLASRIGEEGHRDGIPVVLMEAMARGKPCISTRVSGIPELVRDGESGMLVEPNSPRELADAIRKILESPELANKMGKAGREQVERLFSLSKQAQLMRKEFERALTSIAYISHEFPKITETFVRREIKALRKNGMNVKVFSFHYPHDMKKDESTIYLPSLTSRFFWWAVINTIVANPFIAFKIIVKTLWTYRDSGRKSRILGDVADVLRGFWISYKSRGLLSAFHGSFATMSATSAWSAGLVTGKPFGFSSHSSPHDALMKEKSKDAHWILSESEFDCSYISQYVGEDVGEKIKIVRCGIDPEEWEEPDWQSDRWARAPALFVGTLGPKKGVLTLAKAVVEIAKSRDDFRLEVVGMGPLLNNMKDILIAENCEQLVRFHGELTFEELKKLYYRSRFLVLPAEITPEGDRDGIPVSLMEAMASGMPCISTDVSGIPELVHDSVNGFLIPSRNFIALKDAILKLWDNSDLCLTMGKKARELVFKRHDLDENTKLFVTAVKKKLLGGE